jgi:dihydrofolate reductase
MVGIGHVGDPSGPDGGACTVRWRRIGLMGANIDQQYLAAGLMDEIRIHVVDVLLGGGRRLFDQLPQRVELYQIGVSNTGGVTHLEYRVVR